MPTSEAPDFPPPLAGIIEKLDDYKITLWIETRMDSGHVHRRPKFTPQPGLIGLAELNGPEWAVLRQFAGEMGAQFFRIVHPTTKEECRAQFSFDEHGRGTPYEESSSSTTTMEPGKPTTHSSRHLVRIVLHTPDVDL